MSLTNCSCQGQPEKVSEWLQCKSPWRAVIMWNIFMPAHPGGLSHVSFSHSSYKRRLFCGPHLTVLGLLPAHCSGSWQLLQGPRGTGTCHWAPTCQACTLPAELCLQPSERLFPHSALFILRNLTQKTLPRLVSAVRPSIYSWG